MTDRYEREDEDVDDPVIPELCEAQPDHFCECRSGIEMRQRWQHDPACRRWAPPLTGPGSTPAGRERARQLFEAARRAKEAQP